MRRFVILCAALVACKGAEQPRTPSAAAQTLAVSRPGLALHGVASDGGDVYAAFAPTTSDGASRSAVEARHGTTVAWTTQLGGTAGELVLAGPLLAVALAGTGTVNAGAAVTLRGDPGAVIVALARETGTVRWQLALDSNQWVVVTASAALGDDVVIAGSFGGTLRAGTHVVTSAGGSDGFVARLSATGGVLWLVRMGGAGSDAIQGIAATSTRIAIAGTFTAGADVLGQPLAPYDERSPFGDAFVAELGVDGTRRWAATFGGRADDTVAGVAIARERIAVAASVRDVVAVGSANVVTSGPSDGLVVWFGDGGEYGATALVGGLDFDGLRAITAVDDRVVVGGFFSGAIELAGRRFAAGGGDDSFLAEITPSGAVSAAWHVGGAGREEITALASVPGGFVAGVAHTAAAEIDGVNVVAPADPATGAAIVVR